MNKYCYFLLMLLFVSCDQKEKIEMRPSRLQYMTRAEQVDYFNSFNPMWRKAIQDNDATAILELYDDDAIVGAPEQAFYIGKAAVAKYWTHVAKILTDFSYQTQHIGGNPNDILYENGIALATYRNAQSELVTDTSKYLFVWKYVGHDKYEVVSEMFNKK